MVGTMAKIDDSVKKKVPELRFKVFTDDWEERKLGSLTTVVRGASPRPIQDPKWFDKESDIGWLRIADVTEQNGRIYHLEQHISKLGQEKTRVLTEPHLLLSIAATVGKPVVNYVKTGVHDGFLIFLNPTFEREFMFQWLEMFRPKWQKYGQPGSQVNLNSELVRNQEIVLPNYKEQQKIGSFFKQLDNTITLHQRKLDLLKEQKKGYLQKMFPKNGAKVPELRFAGFADDWEDRKLSSIAERVTRKNKNNESTLPLTISAQDGLVDQNDYFNKQVASRDVTGYFLVKNGEFAYNKSYSNGYPWGAIKRLDKYEMGVLSTLYIVFKPTAINSQFLVSYYETTRWYREVSKNAAEGARNHGLLNISPNDFFNTLLTIPKSAEEQQQIGSFFKQLDDTIALHQHKLDLLKEQKKGFLQKMFV
ncbi:restriction endonuclease subunit S [Lactococcus cremoris]